MGIAENLFAPGSIHPFQFLSFCLTLGYSGCLRSTYPGATAAVGCRKIHLLKRKGINGKKDTS
jgi:hypothetical protein